MKSSIFAGACFAILLGASAQDAVAIPTVSITSPTANKNFGAPATIPITATATPSAGTTITKVDFYRGGTTLIGTATASPYTITWTNVAIGNYSLTAKATDSAGGTKTSTAVAITVKTNVKPTVSITAPANNAVYSPPASIVITANAADSDGTISKVDFYRGGTTLLGTVTAAPYTYTLSGVAAGSYSLTTKATDNSGGVTTSTAVAVVVAIPPTVSLTAPVNNASYTPPASIALAATATPAAGATISKVDFYNGTTLLRSDTSSPYSYTWSSVAAGSYSLTAKATDSKGATATSAAVAVTVSIPSPPPTVSITSPAAGSTFPESQAIAITAAAAATAAGATISKVDFYDSGILIGTAPTAPFTVNLANATVGRHILTAKATDSVGTSTTSASVYTVVDGSDSCITSPPISALTPATTYAALDRFPMTFEANAGQAHPDVRFQARGPGYQLFLTGTAAVLALQDASAAKAWASGNSPRVAAGRANGVAVRMQFVGANRNPAVTGIEPVEEKSNYLAGPNPKSWHTDVPRYAKVRYENLYPGIDEIFYGSQGKLEFDLVVAPGASPRAIRLGIEGADKVSLDKNGNLLLKTPLGTLAQHKPVAYQDIDGERRVVPARYQLLASNRVGFGIGKYDARYPLVIDPVLVYSTYIGGTTDASGVTAIAVSRCGEAFITGTTAATDFPTTPGSFTYTPAAGNYFMFVSKLNQSGTGLLYSTYIPGAGTQPKSLAVDGTGHAYVAGMAATTDFPITPGSVFEVPAYMPSGYVAKLNTAGNAFLYSTYMGGDEIDAIAVDAAGNAYAAGQGAAWKINPTGSALVYSVGGCSQCLYTQVAVDASGSAYLAGKVFSADLATTAGAFQTSKPSALGVPSAFVEKISPDGAARVFSTYIGTASTFTPSGMAIDALGNVYIAANADTSKIIPNYTGQITPIDRTPSQSGYTYAYVAKLNADGGSLGYVSRVGGYVSTSYYVDGYTQISGLAVDPLGSAWITGTTSSTEIPMYAPLITRLASGYERFVVKLTSQGYLAFSTILDGQLGSNGFDASIVAVDPLGSAYVAGGTNMTDFPTTAGAFQTGASGPYRGFVSKINETKDTYTALVVSPNPGLVGTPVSLNATVTGNPLAGPAPTGSVTFLDGTTTLATIPVSGASAALEISQPSGGTHNFTAAYSGDTFHRPSTSVTVPVLIADPNGLPTVTLTGINDGDWFATNSGSTLINKAVTATASAAAGNTLQQVRISYKTGSTFWNLGGLNTQTDVETLTLPAMTPGFYFASATATDNYAHSVSSAPIRFTVNSTTAAPSAVAITAPVNGASFAAQSPIVLTASATAAGGATISYIEFYQGSTWIGADNTSPYSITWSNVPPGTYSLIALATDSAGGKTLSIPITITVIAPPPPPTVAITSPANNASFTTPVDIPITASATPASGATISKVDFYDGAALLGTVTASPYTYTWTSVPAGIHALTAKATDSRGATATTTAVTVTVTSPTPPPAITLTSPASGATFDNSATIPLAATASTTAGTIAKIEFFDGATLLGTVNGSASALSATFDFANASVGSHAISAKATTSDGTVNTTPANTITVTSSVVVVLTSPADGATYVTGQSVAMNAMAASSTQVISRIDFYVDNVLAGTGAIGAKQGTANATWVATAGAHTLSARAVTSANFTTPSADVAITVGGLGITLTEPAMGQNYIAPGSVRLSALAPVAAGNSVARVEFFNGATKLGEAITAPYSILWSNVAAGSYSVSAKATDAQGFSIESASAAISVIAAPAIFASGGLDGSTVADSSATITGTVQTPLNSAVTVNGVPAVITNNGEFFVNGLPLDAGPNTLVINVITADGVSSSQTITVHGSGPSPFKFEVDRSSGMAPLTANFTVSNPGNAAFDKIELDFQNDGTADLVLTALPAPETIALLFPGPGIGRVTMKVKDVGGNVIFTQAILVYVYAATEKYNLIKGVYTGMVDRLKAGDKTGALNLLIGNSREKYDDIFTTLGADLALFAAQLGSIASTTALNDAAEMIISREVAGVTEVFTVYLILGADGIWRIDSM